MDRIKFSDGLDVYSEDYIFEQNGIQKAINNLFRSLTSETSTGLGGIIRGFNLKINSIDNTKVDIYHNNGYSIGEAWSNNFDYIETSTGASYISMANYVASSINIIAIKLLEIDTNNRINVVTGQNNPTRILRNWQYQVFTSTGWIGQDLNGWVEIGRITSNGIGMPLTNLDLSHVNYWSAIINSDYITESMLSSSFRLYQIITRQSSVYDDNFTVGGTKTTLEDDLSEIRSILKNILGTDNYTDAVPGTLLDIDSDLTALHGEGVFKGFANEFNFLLFFGFHFFIDTGKLLFNKKIGYAQLPMGLTNNQPSHQIVGNWPIETGYETVVLTSVGEVVYLTHNHVINNGSIHLTDTTPIELTVYLGVHIGIDYTLGKLTCLTGTGIGTYRFYYQYYTSRIDIVQIDNNYNPSVSIKQGTDVDDTYLTPVEPDADTGHFKLWAIPITKDMPQLTSTGFLDRRYFLQHVNQNNITRLSGPGLFMTSPNYTIEPDDLIDVYEVDNVQAGYAAYTDVNIYLPYASRMKNRKIKISLLNSFPQTMSNNTMDSVTIIPQSGETINGQSSYRINNSKDSVELMSLSGSNSNEYWQITNKTLNFNVKKQIFFGNGTWINPNGAGTTLVKFTCVGAGGDGGDGINGSKGGGGGGSGQIVEGLMKITGNASITFSGKNVLLGSITAIGGTDGASGSGSGNGGNGCCGGGGGGGLTGNGGNGGSFYSVGNSGLGSGAGSGGTGGLGLPLASYPGGNGGSNNLSGGGGGGGGGGYGGKGGNGGNGASIAGPAYFSGGGGGGAGGVPGSDGNSATDGFPGTGGVGGAGICIIEWNE